MKQPIVISTKAQVSIALIVSLVVAGLMGLGWIYLDNQPSWILDPLFFIGIFGGMAFLIAVGGFTETVTATRLS